MTVTVGGGAAAVEDAGLVAARVTSVVTVPARMALMPKAAAMAASGAGGVAVPAGTAEEATSGRPVAARQTSILLGLQIQMWKVPPPPDGPIGGSTLGIGKVADFS